MLSPKRWEPERDPLSKTLTFDLQLNNELGAPPPGARGLAYIALLDESGPSDQTDLHPTVFLDPQRRWSIIREVEADWPRGGGGRPRD